MFWLFCKKMTGEFYAYLGGCQACVEFKVCRTGPFAAQRCVSIAAYCNFKTGELSCLHAGIISATIHVDHAQPCPLLLTEKLTAGLDATSIIGSCRNVFQLEVLRLRLLLGRLLANMEAAAAAAAAAAPVSGRGPSSGPLSETCALPRRSSTVQVPQDLSLKLRLRRVSPTVSVPDCSSKICALPRISSTIQVP